MAAKHFVGSQRDQVSSAIAAARTEVATDWVDMEMSDNKTDVTITIPAGNADEGSNLVAPGICPFHFS